MSWPGERQAIKVLGGSEVISKGPMVMNTFNSWQKHCQCNLNFSRFVRRRGEKRGLTETGVKMLSFLYNALLKKVD